MGNSLKMDLTGKYVVVDKEIYKDEILIFLCEGGFGCSSFTHGRAVFGKWLSDNTNDRIDGYSIKRFATEEEVKNKKLESKQKVV